MEVYVEGVLSLHREIGTIPAEEEDSWRRPLRAVNETRQAWRKLVSAVATCTGGHTAAPRGAGILTMVPA
jgi:hypothetical protein